MGGSAQENLDLLEQKIKFTLRPLINSIKTTGMNKERRMELDHLLLEITSLQQSLEKCVEEEGSTENKIRLTGLVDYLYALIKGSNIQVKLPERRQDIRNEIHQGGEPADAASKAEKIRILNVSLGGMRLHTLKKLKVGSVFHTKLNSSRYGSIPLRGEVVWLRPKQNGEGYIVGIHFFPLEKDVRQALAGFLEECGVEEHSEDT
jgi:hypothetical protein